MCLSGLWGSRFSRQAEGKKPLGKLWSRITLRVGTELAPGEVSAERVEREVRALLGQSQAGQP
jgi:hypothetical protein